MSKHNPHVSTFIGFLMFIAAVTLVMGLLMIVGDSEAAEPNIKPATITISPPTKRADGTNLPASEIKHYQIDFTGPNGTVYKVLTPDLVSKWNPPVLGDYMVQAYTVDTESRMSGPTPAISYTAIELPPEVAPPMPPTMELSFTLPIDSIETPELGATYSIEQPATGFFDKSASTDGKNWESIEFDGRTPMQAPTAETSAEFEQNAQLDFIVSTKGGAHTITLTGYANDGMSDSVWVGLNGQKNDSFNEGKPVFFNSAFKRWITTQPMTIELPEGQSAISIFMREPGLMIDSFELTKTQ